MLNRYLQISLILKGYPYLTFPYGKLFECIRPSFKLLKSTFNAENFMCRLFITIEMCAAAENRKKTLKPPILGFKVIQGHWCWHQYKSLSPVLVVVNSTIVPICNGVFTRFSKRPANVQQFTCILNTFAGICWTFAGSCKHPITYRFHATRANSGNSLNQGHEINVTLTLTQQVIWTSVLPSGQSVYSVQ